MIPVIVVNNFSNFPGFGIDIMGKDISFVVGKWKAIGKIPVVNGCIDQADGTVVLGIITVYNPVFIAQVEEFIPARARGAGCD